MIVAGMVIHFSLFIIMKGRTMIYTQEIWAIVMLYAIGRGVLTMRSTPVRISFSDWTPITVTDRKYIILI